MVSPCLISRPQHTSLGLCPCQLPLRPAMEGSPVAPADSMGAAKGKGTKASSPLAQALPPEITAAPQAGEEGCSSESEVGTQRGSNSGSPKLQGEASGSTPPPPSSPQEQVVQLAPLIPHISCSICKGYLIDATAITECLHTFCKSCIIKHFEFSKRCPKCNIVVHEAKPHRNLRLDPHLQNIVYKLVAGLQEKEKKQRDDFSKKRSPEALGPAVPHPGPSTRGSTKLCSTAGECDISLLLESMDANEYTGPFKPLKNKVVQVAGNTTVDHIEKLLKTKMGLGPDCQVDISCGGGVLLKFRSLREVQCAVGDAGMQDGQLVLYYRLVGSPLNAN